MQDLTHSLSYRCCARRSAARRGRAARCLPHPEEAETGAAETIAYLRAPGEVARGRREGEHRDADRRGRTGGQGKALAAQRVGRGLFCRH